MGHMRLAPNHYPEICPAPTRKQVTSKKASNNIKVCLIKVSINKYVLVTAVKGKLGEPAQFDALKKIGSGPHLKITPKFYF